MLRPPEVEACGDFLVVRDDRLPGGTKRRVLPALMACWPESEFVFGGPSEGYAQVALAYSAADVGKHTTYFVAKRNTPHALTVEARMAGARIVPVPAGRLSVVQRRAKDYAAEQGARFLPLGFDVPEFHHGLVALARGLNLSPPEVWCAAGSGALTRALQTAWPQARHYAVQVGFPPNVGAATLLKAPEEFRDRALRPPPIPSCASYDAKVWQFLSERGRPGALWWNVGA